MIDARIAANLLSLMREDIERAQVMLEAARALQAVVQPPAVAKAVENNDAMHVPS